MLGRIDAVVPAGEHRDRPGRKRRTVRRRVAAVSGTVELRDGSREPVTAATLAAAPEAALQLLAAAIVTLAAALLVLRLR